MAFLAAFQVIFTQRSVRLAALVLGIPSLAGIWAGDVLPGLPRFHLIVGFHLLAATFISFTMAMILWNIFQEERVTSDSIYGAFCGYLLAGVAFGHLFCFVENLSPGSFQGGPGVTVELRDEDRCHFLLTYFSFITLTTVGYGDIRPGDDAARALAAAEGVLGQFYIAVLIAELIGKRVSQALADQPTNSKP
jgi:hypothetical protein